MERVLRQQLKVGFLSAVNFIIYIGTQKSIGRITNNIFPNFSKHPCSFSVIKYFLSAEKYFRDHTQIYSIFYLSN